MKKTIFKAGLFLVVALFAMSCSKDGAVGPAGANGINGTNGTNGNANVIGTNTFSVPPSSWTSSGGNSIWSTTLVVPQITQAVVDRGTVSVFYQSGSIWMALPNSNPQNHYFSNFGFIVGGVGVYMVAEQGYTITPGTTIFRVVVISPSNKMENPNTDWNNYNEVKSALNLPD